MNLTTKTAIRLKEIITSQTYFTKKEMKMRKRELLLQGTLALQECKTKEDAMEIIAEIWQLGEKQSIINFKNELKEIIDKDIDELRSALENTQGLSNYLIGRMRGSLDTLIDLRKKLIQEIEEVEDAKNNKNI